MVLSWHTHPHMEHLWHTHLHMVVSCAVQWLYLNMDRRCTHIHFFLLQQNPSSISAWSWCMLSPYLYLISFFWLPSVRYCGHVNQDLLFWEPRADNNFNGLPSKAAVGENIDTHASPTTGISSLCEFLPCPYFYFLCHSPSRWYTLSLPSVGPQH